MRIQFNHFHSRRRESGMATLIFLALMAIMMILFAANLKSLAQLRTEEKWLEQKQIQWLDSQTNVVAVELSATPKAK